MNKNHKAWVIAGIILILIGGALMAITAESRTADAKEIIVRKMVTNTHKLDAGTFSNIYISCDTADIRFIPEKNSEARVVLEEQENDLHRVRVIDGTLTIDLPRREEKKNLLDFLDDALTNFSFSSEKVTMTLYLPADKFNSLTINTSTGDIDIPVDYTFKSVNITGSTSDVRLSCRVTSDLSVTTSTGAVTLTDLYAYQVSLKTDTGDITAGFDLTAYPVFSAETNTGKIQVNSLRSTNFSAKTSTGKVILKDTTASLDFFVHTTTGDVSLDRCDAQSIKIETSTGDVRGNLKSEKIFFTHTSTGKVNVPKTTSGGTCEITTSTGDIEIDIW